MCPECRSFPVFFTLDHVSLTCFTAVVFFSPLCCDPALSVFASKCQGECHAVKAVRCDLGDPGWGDPWFSALSFVASCTLSVAHGDFVILFPLLSCIMGLRT